MRNILEAQSQLSDELTPSSGYPELDGYPVEEIAGLRFCIWPDPPELVSIGPSARITFLILGAFGVLIALSAALVRFIFVDPILGGKIAGISGLALMGGSYAATIVVSLASRRPTVNQAEVRPPGIPSNAVPVIVATRLGDSPLGRTAGWMWVDRSWLCFRGALFGFRLQASDFKGKMTPHNLEGGQRLTLPKPFPTMGMFIRRRYLSDDRWRKWNFKDTLGDELEVWRSSAKISESRLYPPVRLTRKFVRVGMGLLGWSAIGVALGLSLAGFNTLVPPEARLPGGLPAFLVLILVLPFIFGTTVLGEIAAGRSCEKALRAAAEQDSKVQTGS